MKRIRLAIRRRQSRKAPPTQRRQAIMADRFARQWAYALGIVPEETRRVVIDAECGHVLRIHVEKLGDERMLEVVPPSRHGAEVTYSASGANATTHADTWKRRVGR